MPSDIPEYYRHLVEKKPQQAAPSQAAAPPPGAGAPDPAATYRAHRFTLCLPDDWQDKTVYVLAGPSTDDLQHNLTVNASPLEDEATLVDFADWQVKVLEEQLKGCRLLLKEPFALENGLPAYRAIFVWYPTEALQLYQEQLYVLYEQTAYTLTASFTKKTRKTLGPAVEAVMRSFNPVLPLAPPPRR